jgi:hypothetical protein
MDGTLARANCLLITTLWSAFKFVMVPIGAKLARALPTHELRAPLRLHLGLLRAADHTSEIVGSLFGKQKLRVWGMGDPQSQIGRGHRRGIRGLARPLSLDRARASPSGLLVVLAVVISISNTFLELFSPRGTDDFTMATGNALLCWAFGALSYAS